MHRREHAPRSSSWRDKACLKNGFSFCQTHSLACDSDIFFKFPNTNCYTRIGLKIFCLIIQTYFLRATQSPTKHLQVPNHTHFNMWALVLEAILNGGCDWGLVLDAFFEIIKVADLYSDIMFIITLSKFDSILGDVNAAADDLYKVPVTEILIATSAFTLVGLAFQLVNILLCSLSRRRNRENPSENDSEKAKKKRACWNQINWCLEDLPQFLILAFVVGLISANEFLPCESLLDEGGTLPPGESSECNTEQQDYIDQLEMDGMISFIFTSTSSCRAIRFCCTAWRNGTCCICCDRDDEEDTFHGSSGEGDTGHVQEAEPSCWEEDTGHLEDAEASWEDDTSQELDDYVYSKTIRTETMNPDGSKTVTITKTCRSEDNMCEN